MVWIAFAGAAVPIASCSEGAAAAAAPADGTLVLDLGGDEPSLSRTLQRYGVRLAAPRDYRTVLLPGEVPPPAPGGPAEAAAGDKPRAAEAAGANGAATPAGESAGTAGAGAEAAWFEVPLPKGKSLIHLAKQYLGDANRFRELLALNGWTEKDARTLREGTKVKIPKETGK
jgi:hypothetical protein